MVGSYRASTLRKRLREWRKYLTWLEIVHQVRWPSRRAHAIDFLVELRLAEAPPTVPQSFATTLAFFERAAGIGPEDSHLSRCCLQEGPGHDQQGDGVQEA